jgi:RHS repeat-associated protein
LGARFAPEDRLYPICRSAFWHTFTYDGDGQLATVNGTAATYTYDGEGHRLRKDAASGYTEYIYFGGGVIAEKTASGWTNYVYFNGKRTARRDPGGAVHFYLGDHLGSTSMIVSSSGAVEDESEYYPFGGELQFSAAAGNHYKFTGKERDAETNLDYFGARHYSSGMGRFMIPDWSSVPAPVPYANPLDPQSLNQYSYAGNNPMVMVDPSGHNYAGMDGLNRDTSAASFMREAYIKPDGDEASLEEIA